MIQATPCSVGASQALTYPGVVALPWDAHIGVPTEDLRERIPKCTRRIFARLNRNKVRSTRPESEELAAPECSPVGGLAGVLTPGLARFGSKHSGRWDRSTACERICSTAGVCGGLDPGVP